MEGVAYFTLFSGEIGELGADREGVAGEAGGGGG